MVYLTTWSTRQVTVWKVRQRTQPGRWLVRLRVLLKEAVKVRFLFDLIFIIVIHF